MDINPFIWWGEEREGWGNEGEMNWWSDKGEGRGIGRGKERRGLISLSLKI
jgi:hypothetical protein